MLRSFVVTVGVFVTVVQEIVDSEVVASSRRIVALIGPEPPGHVCVAFAAYSFPIGPGSG
jgi:hypothetical protein